ncbi:hypothetical protein MASR1M32_18600 [Rhodobacter sp.]
MGPSKPGRVRSGIIDSIGTTAMSCVSRTAKPARPPGLRIRPFSVSVCSTMAVEDIASIIPITMALRQFCPASQAVRPMARMVRQICAPPRPSRRCRMSHSTCGSSSSPMRNIIITTPNSEMC